MNFRSGETALQFLVEYKAAGATGSGNTERICQHLQNKTPANTGARIDYDSAIAAALDIEKLLMQFTAPYVAILIDVGMGGKQFACEQALKRYRRGGSDQWVLLATVGKAQCPDDLLPVVNVAIKQFEEKLKLTGYMSSKSNKANLKARAA